jgi:PadR family transcriptional regulator, regulatory protein AphA
MHLTTECNSGYDIKQFIDQSISHYHRTEGDAVYWLLTLDYGKRTAKADIEWCEFTLDKLSLRGDKR